MLNWWKENAALFPFIAKAAKVVLATPASEAICERLFKQAKNIGTTDRMAQLRDDTFEMLVMAQYNKHSAAWRSGHNGGEHIFYLP